MWLDCEESADGDLRLERSRSEFVPVVFAQDLADAEHYRGLLEAVSIPALIESPGDDGQLGLSVNGAVLVRVPEHMHDAASEIVAAAQEELQGSFGDDVDDEDDEEDDDLDEDEDDLDDSDDDDLDDFD